MTDSHTYRPLIRHLWRYLLALSLVGAGLLLCLSIPEVLSSRPFLAFWPVVVLAAEFGGKGPGILATVASALCVDLILNPYYGGLNLHEWVGMTALGIFLAGGLAISVFIGEKLKIQSLQRLQAAAMAASEARYRSLFETANVGKSVTLPTGEVQVNRAFCDMLGYGPEDMRGKTWQELTPPEEIEPINQRLAPLLRGEKNTARFEKRYIHKNGSYVWTDVSVAVQFDGEGKPLHFITTVVDITERKRVEAEARREREFADGVLNSLPGVLYCYDESFRFIRWNKNFERVTGYTSDEVVRLSPFDYFAGPDKDLVAARIQEVFEKGEASVEADFVSKDGTRTPYFFTGLATSIEDRRYLVGVGIDVSAHKQAETALRESEQRFASAFHTSPAAITITRIVDGKFIDANQSFLDLFEFNRDEVIGHTSTELNIVGMAERDKLMRKQLKTGGLRNEEFLLRTKSGRTVHLLFSFASMELAGEMHIVSTLIDITARKQAEATLRESEMRFRTMFEQAAVGVAEIETATGRFIRINQRYCDIAGYTREEMLALNVQAIIHPDDLQADLDNKRRLVAGEIREFTMEKRYFRKDRNIVWVSLTVSPMWPPGATPDHHIAIVEDITSRKQIQESLQEREAQLRLFIEYAPAAVAMFDRDMHYLTTSQRWRTAYGLGDQTIIGHSHYDIFPEIPQRWKDIHRRCLAGSIEKCEEDPFPRIDGSTDWIRWEVRPWLRSNDEIGGIIIFSEDITERKQAEQALQQLNLELEQRVEQRTQELTEANAKLQELDRLKSLFIASMSHELRTPLNSIIGFTGIILQGMSGAINAEQCKQLGIVKNNARHLLELINDIIDISKIESGAIELADEAFDLSELVRETIQALTTAMTAKHLTLTLQIPPLLVIRSDRRRLRQVLINLLDNAIKFTDVGGIDIAFALQGAQLMLSVRDSGIGIDTQHQHRLFQAFSQIAPLSDRIHQGTGLGLYLSQRLAGLMGGEITVASAIGAGSCFTLVLPSNGTPGP